MKQGQQLLLQLTMCVFHHLFKSYRDSWSRETRFENLLMILPMLH